VAGNPQLVWCPHPGCGSAIQNPQRDRSESISSAASSHSRSQQYQSFTAHCSNGHAFCWMCQMEPHDPASCEDYKNWLNKIAQVHNAHTRAHTQTKHIHAHADKHAYKTRIQKHTYNAHTVHVQCTQRHTCMCIISCEHTHNTHTHTHTHLFKFTKIVYL